MGDTGVGACPTCGEAVSPTATFCGNCGAPLPTGGTCPRCGGSLSPTARFCGACGTTVGTESAPPTPTVRPAGRRQCPNCGAAVSQKATFCGSCGTGLAQGDAAATQTIAIALQPTKPARPTVPAPSGPQPFAAAKKPAGRPQPVGARVLGVVLALAIVLAGWQFLQPGERPPAGGTPPAGAPVTKAPAAGTPVASAAPTRPASPTTHTSGARVAVPAGPVLYSPEVQWTELPKPETLKSAELLSPVLQFDSYAGLVLEGKVPVDLPAGDAGDDAVVLAWTNLGFWLPLPSQAVTLADGKPGRRVLVDGVPTPWRLTVARGGGNKAELSGPARLELLAWTDKAGVTTFCGCF